MPATRPTRAAACGALGAALLAASCYTYAPAPTLPGPGTRVALEVNDVGRVALARALAPSITRVEGTLVSAGADELVLALSGYAQIRGGFTQLAGDTVRLRRDDVAEVRQRQLSRRRTALVVAAAATAVVAFLAARGIGGRGTPPESRGGDGGGNQ